MFSVSSDALAQKCEGLYAAFWESPSNHADEINRHLPQDVSTLFEKESLAAHWVRCCMEDKESLDKFRHLNWAGHGELKCLLLRTGYALGIYQIRFREELEADEFRRNTFEEYQSEFLLAIRDLVKSHNGDFRSAVKLT